MIIIRLLVWRESKNKLNSSDDSGEGGIVELVSPDEKGSVEENKVDEK